MVDIEFNKNQNITVIRSNLGAPFKEAINKYLQKSLVDPSSNYFLANGDKINFNESVESHMINLNKQNNKIKVLVNSIRKDDKDKEQVIVNSKDIICPECKEPCRITFDNYKIKLFDCINGHVINDIKINEFEDTQKINESNIICENCEFKNKGNCPKSRFFKCLTCEKNLCLLCKPNHNFNHNIILYEQKNYICQRHNEPLIKYCKKCKINICFACEDHEEHESLFLGDLKPNIEEKKKFLNELKIIIESIESKIKEIINILNEFEDFMKSYYDIINSLVSNYEVKNRNYQILQNLHDISDNNKIYDKLKNINDNIDIKNKINDIIDLYKRKLTIK